ncbi:MAG TPA: hypothetical protein VF236_04490 [Gaiellaceae bacterium]
MPSIPFTAYDIFAYLTSGFVVIAAGDFAFPGSWILDRELTVVQVFVWIGVAYIVGHVVAGLSAPAFQELLVEGKLGKREQALWGGAKWKKQTRSRLKWLFPGYFDPLPEDIKARVESKARKESIAPDRDGLFLYCDAQMRQKPEVAPVLGNFLNIYAFARNACLAALVAAVLLVVGAIFHRSDWETKAWLAAAAVVVAIFLFYRYVKFFRLYARDVFLFYSTADSPTSQRCPK